MIVLLYNLYFNRFFSIYDILRMDELKSSCPPYIHVTTDRSCFGKADVVVFNIPHLPMHLNGNLIKRKGQIWVGWSLESEKNYPWMFVHELKRLIDVWMTYHLDSDIPIPYLNASFVNKFKTPYTRKPGNVCMFISSPVNNSRRFEYLRELMGYISIDSYGRWCNNVTLLDDCGYLKKQQIISGYKFTIAFENAKSENYVTEKFYDPLLAGSVPVYLGAPDVETFNPGSNSFLDICKYLSPKKLAQKLLAYCNNEKLYEETFFSWKGEELNKTFLDIVRITEPHPFSRLFSVLEHYASSDCSEPVSVEFKNGVLRNYQ